MKDLVAPYGNCLNYLILRRLLENFALLLGLLNFSFELM